MIINSKPNDNPTKIVGQKIGEHNQNENAHSDIRELIEQNSGYTKEEILSSNTKELYGLGEEATPNDLFAALKVPTGYYGFAVTVKTSDGSLFPNLALTNLQTLDLKGTATTDENGFCYAVSSTKTVNVPISKYIGIVDITVSLEAWDAGFKPVTITVEKDTSLKLTTTSGTYKVFPEVAYIDLCAVGGGGGAGGSAPYNTYYGGAGGGGYVTNLLNVTPSNELIFTIGAGGSGGSSNYSTANSGSAGGTTSIVKDGTTILTASGGSGGTYRGEFTNSGGAGNGRGGTGAYGENGSAGVNGSVYVFNDTSLPLPGGGGGGISMNYGGTNSGVAHAGGKSFGGTASVTGAGGKGTGPGGGGGATQGLLYDSDRYYGYAGGAGYSGGVYYRARYE